MVPGVSRFDINTQCVATGQWASEDAGLPGALQPRPQRQPMEHPIVEGADGEIPQQGHKVFQKAWEVEPDQRHADLIIQELELEKANAVLTPGEKEPRIMEGENEE